VWGQLFWKLVGGVQAGLGRPHILGEGLNILGQREVGRGMVVARRVGGRGYRLQVGPIACPWGWWKGAGRDCLPASGGWGAGGRRVARSLTNPTCVGAVEGGCRLQV